MEGWVKQEIEGCDFSDARLKKRFGRLLGQLGEKIGATLPTACQDWAATKAAYRFFSNPRVDESIILAGHFAATKSRMAAAKGPILILHDTTEFSYQREQPEAIGKTRRSRVLPAGAAHRECVLCLATDDWRAGRYAGLGACFRAGRHER